MTKIIKAKVIAGRYQGNEVRVTNVSVDEMGRKKAACLLASGERANIPVEELEVLPPPEEKEIIKAKTASMPFISGSTSSRSMTHTKNMGKLRQQPKTSTATEKVTLAVCEKCGQDYNLELRKGEPGKLTECENCAEETETKMEGTMIFSHKTGATIEIKKDGALKHEADTFYYKK